MTKKKGGAKRAANMQISDLKRQKKAQEDKKLKKQNKKSEKLREEKEKLSEKEREKEFEAKLAEQKRHLGAEHQRKLAAALAQQHEEHKTQLAEALAKQQEMYFEAAKHQNKLAKIGGKLDVLKVILNNQAKTKAALAKQTEGPLEAEHQNTLANTEGELDVLGAELEKQTRKLAKYKETLQKVRAQQEEKHLDEKHQKKLAKTECKLEALGAELEKQTRKSAKYKKKLKKALAKQEEEASEVEDVAQVEKNLKVPGKSDTNDFLSELMKVDLSNQILCSIIFNKLGKLSFTTVGRPETSASPTHQLEHIIPYSFVRKSIDLLVANSNDFHEAFIRLSKFALIFTQSLKNGLALSPEDHTKNGETPQSFAYGYLTDHGVKLSLASPRHENQFTPRTADRAKKKFPLVNYKFIQKGLEELYTATATQNQEGGALNYAAEALARFIFILFNSGEHVSFSKIGNSPREEIRLYSTEEDAKQRGNKSYKIVSAEELLDQAKKLENLDERIRLSKCEGNYVKKAHEALKTLNNILLKYNETAQFDKTLVTQYNKKYNIQLKLFNNHCKLQKYNAGLVAQPDESIIYKHAAKILYSSFDLKGLPKIVLTPSSNFKNPSQYKIKIFANTTATKAVDYEINLNAEEQRNQEIKAAKGNQNIFRDKEVDKKILATKIVELYFIGTYPFSELIKKAIQNKAGKYESPILKSLVSIAIKDHDLNAEDAKNFQEEVSDLEELFRSSDSEEPEGGSNLLGLFNQAD